MIFSEPHAYIPPGLYERELNVPTWNYLAFHAYGQGRLMMHPDEISGLLEKQMQVFEHGYLAQWSGLPAEYKNGLVQGVVAFELDVTKLEAKRKLNQNKTARDRENVRTHLLESDDPAARQIGEYMTQVYQKK